MAVTLLLAAIGTGAAAHDEVIRMRNRVVHPATGVDPQLLAAFRDAGTRPTPALAWFEKLPSVEDRRRLEAAGFRVDTYLGTRAYLIELRPGTALTDLPRPILWIGALDASDKVEPRLWRNEVEPWARTREGTLRVLVTVHQWIGAEAETVLRRHAANVRPHQPPRLWAAEVTPDALRRLAAEPAVRVVEAGPHPMMPL